MANSEARRVSTGWFSRSADGPRDARPLFVQLPLLWKAMILTSFLINLILIGVIVGGLFFVWKWRPELGSTMLNAQSFAQGNVAELRDVVQQLQAAHIKTTIPLDQQLPLKGKGVVVPVDQQTQVTLTSDVPLNLAGADIDLGAGNRLRAQNISLVLPAGTPLNIALKMDIPLDNVTIPIRLDVPVDIAMADTELAPQFKRLGNVVDRLVYPVRDVVDLPDVQKPDPPQVPK
ncbi:hypothetical protein SE17_21950 [Kouleothrix aurantiaca]|jgi:hypothetical protein|uniref:Uncharacterized protein n=1 Tax=Kouleothrix aurantiaca TaxID=186479 RepID=A0A0P9CY56_9CHLR|nr:hypothetical protein SE17_21950 [Kouleothrix aurantiaca]